MKKWCLLAPGLLFLSPVAAQTDCEETLQAADKSFQAGKFSEAASIVEPCVGSGRIKPEKSMLYRLAALSYFRMDNSEKADIYARKLLKSNPDYRQFPMSDPRDFARFLESYDIHVAWQGGIRAGMMISFPEIIKQYSVSEQVNSYTTGAQYSAGVQITRRLNKALSLRFEPGYGRLQYNRHNGDIMGVSQDYSEIQNYLDLPLNLLWMTTRNHFNFYTITGVNAAVLAGAYGLIESRDIQTDKRIVDSYAVLNQRRNMMYALNAGLGMDITAGKGRLGLSASWQHCLRNMVIAEKRYENMPQVISSKYVENDFKIHALRIQVYYQIPLIYQVTKK